MVHGITTSGDEISLLDAWVNQISNGDEITRLHASTLAIGALTITDERWSHAVYSTANLSEWVRENGLSHAGHTGRRPLLHRVDFDPPVAEEVALPRGAVRLEVRAHDVVAHAADWSIETWSDLTIDPRRKFTLNQAFHDYGRPLLAFMHFASDRPDALTREILVGESARRRIEVLRQGKAVLPRPWRPLGGITCSNGRICLICLAC